MAEKVGKKTDKTTTAGRDVYITPEGEAVSEKSVTIKFDDNSYVNAPSIHDGIRYSEDEVRQMLLDGKIKPTSRHDTLEEALEAAQERSNTLMNEGGMAIEKETKPLFSKLFRPEVNLSGETTSKNIDFGELNNEPLEAELKQQMISLDLAQAQTNLEQAKHPSIFVAGARPAIMWICAFALGWQFILAPISSWIIITWYPMVTLPTLQTAELTSLVLALLGLGGMRTAEKWRGVARNNMKQ